MNPMRLYSIDIETVSQGKRALDYTNQAPVKLGNTKDPEKIKAIETKKREEARYKHGLSWWTGKVCSVAITSVFHEGCNLVSYGFKETDILETLASHLVKHPCKLIGKNSIDFDYPFLVGRYMANSMEVPLILKGGRDKLLDIESWFGGRGCSQRGKLSDYSHGIDTKNKLMHGSQVQSVYDEALDCHMKGDKAGESKAWEMIANYNIQDTVIVKDMALRYYKGAVW